MDLFLPLHLKKSARIRKVFMYVSLMCFSASVLGCSDNSYSADELQRVRTALESALDTWKKGEKMDALKAKSIEFTDPDWRANAKLIKYKIDRVEGTKGQNVRGWTHVSLTTRQGRKWGREYLLRDSGERQQDRDRPRSHELSFA